MLGWYVPSPNEAMLVSGSKNKGDAAFRIVVGHGTFALPIKNRVSFLTLAMQEAEVAEPCVTQQGITLQVRAVIAFKVGDDAESIANAGRRFLDDQSSMPELVGRIFAGHLRSIVGSMTVEDIIRERQKLASEVLDASKPEMAKLGLVVDSFQIESIDDGQSGYIRALSQPHIATVNQAAQIAQAQADQAAAKVRQESERNQAQYQQETAVAKAQYQAQIDQAQQTAAQAGPLAQARAQQDVLSEQAKVAQAQAELRRQQLVAEVVRPAEAEAEKVRTMAQAQADATRLQAEATATSNGVVLQRMLVERMPDILAAAASELRQANVTVLNGAEGLGELVAGLAAQATSILDVVRRGVNGDGLVPVLLAPSGPGAGAAPVPPSSQPPPPA
ncbi:MAG TPA: SPFH domain-containing protein [Acidimicrobiales bacterium]|nr:SPFH domain-containing protein [Acidimicrobiales bacterium]